MNKTFKKSRFESVNKGATISLSGGRKFFFFSRVFFSVDVKAEFFFTRHLKPVFFHKELKLRCFLNSHAWYRHLFLPLCWPDRFFFFVTYQSKKNFQHTGRINLFFSGKSSDGLFFQKVFQAPGPQIKNGRSLSEHVSSRTGVFSSFFWRNLQCHAFYKWVPKPTPQLMMVSPH